MSIEVEQARFLRCIGEPTGLQILKLLAESESLMKELPLSQSKGVCYDEREDQECCESQILTNS